MTLEKILRWITIAGIFALPFIPFYVSGSLFFPYITGKNFAFRIIVEIITGAWIALVLVYPRYRHSTPRASWILGAFGLFVLIVAIADANGVNPFKSFWSNYERMDGWVTLAHVFLYTVVASAMLQMENLWRRLFQLSLILSLVLSVYGFLQIIGAASLGQGGVAGLAARVDATFGNPIYLAAYMLFHIFIAAMLWAQMWTARKHGESIAPSFFYASVILFDTATLFFTGTRGTVLGLAAGIIIASFIIVILARESRNAWRAAVGAVVLVFLFAMGVYTMRDSALVRDVGFLNRLATISIFDPTIASRFLNMGIAWQGVKERPLLGWGQENYAIVFDKYYDPRMYAQEPWFDRVHDILFDWLIAAGFIGLISYLSIFAATLVAVWKRNVFMVSERAILTGLLVAYFVHNLAVFDNITSYILFGTVLAYIHYRGSSAGNAQRVFENVSLPKYSMPIVVACAVVVVWVCAWWVNAPALATNRDIIQAIQPQSGGVQENLKYFLAASNSGSFGVQEAREQLSQAAGTIASQNVSLEIKQAFFKAAVEQMTMQEKASPLDARFPLFVGIVEDAYGAHKDAEVSLSRAHELSPRKQGIIFQQASNASARGDTKEMLEFFKSAYELEPKYTDARILYAAAAIRVGDLALASILLEPIIVSGEAADPRITVAYATRGNFAPLIPIWKARVTARPQEQNAYMTLAAIYYKTGNRTQAVAVLQSAVAIFPTQKIQIESFIEQIKNGTAQVD